jgi:hypothetical protein
MAIASTLALGACAANQADQDNGNEVTDPNDSKADGQTPLRMGTYDVDFDVYYALTLHDDGTFHLQGGCRPNDDGPSCFAITVMDGNYHLTKSGTRRYIRLYNGIDDSLAYRFRYTVSGEESETLDLVNTHDHSTSSATLEQADKKQEGESCGGFVVAPGQCADGLVCVTAQHCCDLPGTCQQPAN